MIGDDALVPPYTFQPDAWYVSYTARPVCGSATADTSASARSLQPVVTPAWKLGLAISVEQPLPASDQAVSLQPRELPSCVSDVPPTAVTCAPVAGNDAP